MRSFNFNRKIAHPNYGFYLASSMSSWSYQSTTPCTVLVKEKQDGLSPSRDCPPPILHSSTETAASSQDQPEISSLGNSVGGKKSRSKRQAHGDGFFDVVFENGDGHEREPPVRLVEKRILVNISIAMDKGLGSMQQQVYQLQVAVPLPKKETKSPMFYAYDVGESATEGEKVVETSEATTDDSITNDSSTTTFDDFITSSTDAEGLEN